MVISNFIAVVVALVALAVISIAQLAMIIELKRRIGRAEDVLLKLGEPK